MDIQFSFQEILEDFEASLGDMSCIDIRDKYGIDCGRIRCRQCQKMMVGFLKDAYVREKGNVVDALTNSMDYPVDKNNVPCRIGDVVFCETTQRPCFIEGISDNIIFTHIDNTNNEYTIIPSRRVTHNIPLIASSKIVED